MILFLTDVNMRIVFRNHSKTIGTKLYTLSKIINVSDQWSFERCVYDELASADKYKASWWVILNVVPHAMHLPYVLL